ncbi:SET and MYND domain-containing protein DDB_G0273589-like [Bradysia coprophila]|uniref:SET and MYND domain-containing protein DDB_G0273589-like n=1 Tax=Bradysia coprophila TaxID=38358 RepID=UPI00187D9525|nr:SET and MYND domain-containing protein DDB_G0273589-like [Bradysia coprophila]XP_037031876.1 SET and MYND domain-containing protein DDB_G0273589-like [Bradysia coprophila]
MWKKQNNEYIDICNGPESLACDINPPSAVFARLQASGCLMGKPKNNHGSKLCREIGNKQFAESKWIEAIGLYNRAICAAKNVSSELVGLAYANRSACFFELQMYEKCLVDITLAKEANFPQRLMAKLDKRRDDCLNFIESGSNPVPFEPKLSFESHPKFTGMANVLEIKLDSEFGRHITVTCDIDVGKIVVMEKAFMTAYRYEKFRRCDTCMMKDTNLIPCTRCTDTMFHSSECKASDFHKVECGMYTLPIDAEDYNDNQRHIIRSILQAVNMFATAEELQQFVEDAIFSDSMEIPESLLDEKSNYREFVKLWHEPNVYLRDMFGQQVYFVHKKLLDHPTIGSKFNTKETQRFLMHLVAQHYCIINYSGNIVFDNSDDLVGWNFEEFRSVIAMYMNHSCAPNATLVSFDGYNVIVTIRPIKAGEQVFLSYFRNDKIQHSTIDRKKYILARCRFNCNCERCNGKSLPSGERNEMKKDECFRYIERNKPKINFLVEGPIQTPAAKELEEKCIEFLNRYGRKIWCNEIDFVTDCYRRLLAAKFNNKIHF